MKKLVYIAITLVLLFFIYKLLMKVNFNSDYEVGQPIDSLNNVVVYFNGGVGNVSGRNTVDGYNVGLKYQCVEFVKRYYFEYYNHRMPDSYGHALSFYDPDVKDGDTNVKRALTQYTNPSKSKPEQGDLLVMDKTIFNPYGHVAIISGVDDDEIEIIQQNPGAFSPSREKFDLKNEDSLWHIEKDKVLGWLRKE